MINPCDDCIIKINCTGICEAKQNQKIFIKHAITQHKGCLHIPAYAKRYSELIKQLREIQVQENIINKRRLEKMGV